MTKKLTHLEHPEDLFLKYGKDGFYQGIEFLKKTHNFLSKNEGKIIYNVKKDGSPSVVFGIHPENNRYFVASKSAWNKTPKINYSQEDIVKNHLLSIGLTQKLSCCFEHLHKIIPENGGVFQGDLMFSENDRVDHGDCYSFTPNTITYVAPKESVVGIKLAKSKIGIFVHTHYKGKTWERLSPIYNQGNKGLVEHEDVLTDFGRSFYYYSLAQKEVFQFHLDCAEMFFEKIRNHDKIKRHGRFLRMYINYTIRINSSPSIPGYQAWLLKRKDSRNLPKEVYSLSQDLFEFFSVHRHMQEAKHQLVDALSYDHDLKHYINGNKTKPEGFVISDENNIAVKFNRRQEFNRLNFRRNNS